MTDSQMTLDDAKTEQIEQTSVNVEPPASDTLTTIAIVEAEERAFALKQRQAKAIACSSLVPKEYQGEANIPNVMIAMNMAKRLNADILHVMQNLYIVHGKPAWSAQFLIATFNSSGRFSAIKYVFNDDKTACKAVTTELSTGEVIEGTTITMEMAEGEGWTKKTGSKWRTMREQMLCYRAATFLVRATAPELALGMYTTDEIEDIAK